MDINFADYCIKNTKGSFLNRFLLRMKFLPKKIEIKYLAENKEMDETYRGAKKIVQHYKEQGLHQGEVAEVFEGQLKKYGIQSSGVPKMVYEMW